MPSTVNALERAQLRGMAGKRRLEGPPPKGLPRRQGRLDFQTFFFCFAQPAQALSHSTPQLLARERRAVAQGAQLAQAICGWTRPPRPQSVPISVYLPMQLLIMSCQASDLPNSTNV